MCGNGHAWDEWLDTEEEAVSSWNESPNKYDASSIKILKPEEASEKFEWLKLQQLADHYHCTTEWIERGFKACYRAGVDKQYFISRYLEKDVTVPINALVNDAYRDLLHEKAGETT
jgi:hypothetical protein